MNVKTNVCYMNVVYVVVVLISLLPATNFFFSGSLHSDNYLKTNLYNYLAT